MLGSLKLFLLSRSELFIICASDRSERALRITVYFNFSGTSTYVTSMYALSANIHYSSSNIGLYQLQVNVKGTG